MALVTLCPGCKTTFRVTPVQLQAHGGDVRCGYCQQVFSGFTGLIKTEAPEISDPAKLAGAEWPQSSCQPASLLPDLTQTEIQQSALEYNFDKAPLRKISRLWIIANFILLLALIGQAIHFYRTEISAMSPSIRPFLESYCLMFRCIVPYPQDISQLSIESSDLRANPADQLKVATLTATIRNHAPFPLALPALKLSLTDVHDQLLASRIFSADDYLPEKTDSVPALEPDHQIDISVDLDSGELNAMGYRLILLYY